MQAMTMRPRLKAAPVWTNTDFFRDPVCEQDWTDVIEYTCGLSLQDPFGLDI